MNKLAFKNYFEDMFEKHDQDCIRTIVYLHQNQNRMPLVVQNNYKELSTAEKNEIIWDVITPF